jgi:putative hydrolases of HD superfamily
MAMSKSYPSVQRIAELQQLVADFAKVERMVQLADAGRRENDVEHSYGLALTYMFLAPRVAPELSLEKILRYALAHDIVELHSGDVFAFDPDAIKGKSQREDDALEQLRKDWPDFPELAEAAQTYKDKSDPEARFVYTIDKLLPTIMVNLGEKGAFWKRHKITREMERKEKHGKMRHSPEVLPYLDMLTEWTNDPDYFYKPE